MANDPARKGGKGCLTVAGRMLATLVIIGVVLGVWRYLGQGAGITDAGWFERAASSVESLMQWANQQVREWFQ